MNLIPLYEPVAVARMWKFIRELPDNKGQRVNAIQMYSSGPDGLNKPWCADFATFVLDACYQGDCPIHRTASCDEIYAIAKKNEWFVTNPLPGDLYLRVRPGTEDAHHVGFVCEMPLNGRFLQISGNTSEDGTSDNGDRVAERYIITTADVKFVRIPRK